MDAKKIIYITVSVVLAAVFIFTLTWGIINFNKVKAGISGTELYTKEDIDNSYDDGYHTALDNKAEYEEIINEYRDKLSEFENIKKELTVSKLKSAELENRVAYLNGYIAECESLIETMTAENYNLKSQIKTLEEIRGNLMQSVNAYVQLIASISLINERFVVTFMFDDTVYSILLVPDGEKVELVNPVSTEYTIFLGWSLSQNGELVDLENLEITADTVLYAKIIRKYDVNFILDYEVYEHHIIERGGTITANTPTSTNKRVFKGWSLDGVNVINITNYPITEHRTFFAVVETRYEVKFVTASNRTGQITTLNTQFIGALSSVSVPTPPVPQGYTFSGWLLNGLTAADPSAYTVTNDVVFVAKYISVQGNINRSFRFGTNGLYGHTDILQYIRNNGYPYVQNMQQLKNFNIQVRVFAGTHNGRVFNLTPNSFAIYRIPCAGFNEFLANGTLFYSVSLLANGFLQMQMSFEGASLVSSSIFSGSLEIVSMSFTLVDY